MIGVESKRTVYLSVILIFTYLEFSWKQCMLCPLKGGAMKKVMRYNSDCEKDSWVHVSCALWIPEIEIGDIDSLSQINIKRILPERWNRVS